MQSSSRSVGPLLLVIFLLLLLIHVWDIPQDFRLGKYSIGSTDKDAPCPPMPGLEDVLVVLKTGATEALEKLPVHFETTLRCVPHFIVYSDYEERIAGQQVHDILEDIDEEIKQSNSDFQLYNRLRSQGRDGLTAAELKEWASVANGDSGALANPAWRLDKWKFLTLIERAFRVRPEAKWYAFMEADTYIMWPSLLDWLSHIDSSKPHYLGSEAQGGDLVFGHGGSGFIISNHAMQMAASQRTSHVKFYNEFAPTQFAGDCVLGKIMEDAGIPLTWSWPHLQGERPVDIDYDAIHYDKRLWCHQAVSYHHLLPEDIMDFSRFEHNWSIKVSIQMCQQGGPDLTDVPAEPNAPTSQGCV